MKILIMAMVRLILLGVCILAVQVTWARLASSASPQINPYIHELIIEPTPPSIEHLRWPDPVLSRSTIELPPIQPVIKQLQWPWSNPGWDEAQDSPQKYLEWLRENNKVKSVKMVKAVITAYCPCAICCGSSADGKTRSNRSALQPGIAVAEPIYQRARRYGRSYHVPGYFPVSHPGKSWIPDDTGSAMLDSYKDGMLHIDIRYQNHGFALSKGVRYGYVYIINQ